MFPSWYMASFNRVHASGEKSSESHGIKNTQHTGWSSWTLRALPRFFPLLANPKSQATSFAPAYDWTVLYLEKFSRMMCRALHTSLSGLFKDDGMVPSDFTSILVRWTDLTVYCTLMPACAEGVAFFAFLIQCISSIRHIFSVLQIRPPLLHF